jgi:hypothetical protein
MQAGGCDLGCCTALLAAGKLVEQGAPADLAAKPGGLFAGMVAAAAGQGMLPGQADRTKAA